ncbi:Aminopyrimidine aminohydrolase [invertebrate metagenome]|uniref:Aminopyrimidine aminohydrolase n=1 Tax=invertebrate metagenome TaxID=1711999 RepID=A0A2H9TA84_9ZZZZ
MWDPNLADGHENAVYNNPDTLYFTLKQSCQEDWHHYSHHPFVQGIADGTLPLASFQHYLQQDYLFLIHFSRAYALAVYKADNIEDMRSAVSSANVMLNSEMNLHLEYCAKWGLTEQDILKKPEARANMAYTRYVLERGMAGDVLDLYTALCPCAVGYGEIGQRLFHDPETKTEGNPYYEWIQSYGSEDYMDCVVSHIHTLDKLMKARGGEQRVRSLSRIFQEATRLEIGFWEMGMSCDF